MHATRISNSSLPTNTGGTNNGKRDRIPPQVAPVVKRFFWSAVFFLILNIWLIMQAIKDGFFRSSDYPPVYREDSFRRGCARDSYKRAIHTGYHKNKRRHGTRSCSSSKASTSETCDSGYKEKSASWTDTSASDKWYSDSSVRWKDESNTPYPLRSNATLVDSDDITSDTDDDVFFVPRTMRVSKETVPSSSFRSNAARGSALLSGIVKPLMDNPSSSYQRNSQERSRAIYVAAMHIHACSVNMGVDSVKTLIANPGPSSYKCVTVQQGYNRCQSHGDIYDARLDWV